MPVASPEEEAWRKTLAPGDEFTAVYLEGGNVVFKFARAVRIARRYVIARLEGSNHEVMWQCVFPLDVDRSTFKAVNRTLLPVQEPETLKLGNKSVKIPGLLDHRHGRIGRLAVVDRLGDITIGAKESAPDEENPERAEMLAAKESTMDLKKFRASCKRSEKVMVRKRVNNVESYVYGRVKAPQRRGASIDFEDGNLSFAFWNDIFPDDRDPKPAKVDKSKAKLGDVIKLVPPVPEPLTLPPTSQPGTATYTIVPDPEPAESADEPSDPESERPSRRKGRAKSIPHALTAIGNIFRSERLKRAWSQKQMAAHLDRRAWAISDIELGDTTPDDDTLLLFSERFGISLDLLLSARDGHQEAAADPVFAMNRVTELEQLLGFANGNTALAQSELTAERNAHIETKAGLKQAELRITQLEVDLDKATMPWDAQALQAVNDFISKLTAVSPVPSEPEKRHAWYEAALKMFGANK